MDKDTIAQTYVAHNGRWFFVSTINRESSAMIEPPVPWYAETLAWEWNPDTKERGEIVGQDEAPSGCIYAHQRMVESLFQTGRENGDGS